MNPSSPAGWAWPVCSEVPKAQKGHQRTPLRSLIFFTEQNKPREAVNVFMFKELVPSDLSGPAASAFPQAPAGWHPQDGAQTLRVEQHWFNDSVFSGATNAEWPGQACV